MTPADTRYPDQESNFDAALIFTQFQNWVEEQMRLIRQSSDSVDLTALFDTQSRLLVTLLNEVEHLRRGIQSSKDYIYSLHEYLEQDDENLLGFKTQWEALEASHRSPIALCYTREGFPIFFNNRDPGAISWQLRMQRRYEPEETAFIRQHLSSGSVFVDVGANIGFFSVLAARLVGNTGRVYAFEPDPENAAILAQNVATLPHPGTVNIIQVGAGSQSQVGYLFRCADNFGDHRLFDTGETDADGRMRQTIPIRIQRIDDILGAEKRVDLVKVDTQGFEVEVFRGMEQTLQKFRPLLLFEFWPFGLRGAGYHPPELLQEIAKQGYQFYLIGNSLKRVEVDSLTVSDPLDERYWNLIGIPEPVRHPGVWLDARTLDARRPRRSFYLTFDQVFDGEGWHPGEMHPDFALFFCWTAERYASLDLLLEDAYDYFISFEILTAADAALVDNLRLQINHIDISLDRQPAASTIIFSGKIPRTAVAENTDNTRLTFDTGYTVSARDAFGGEDTRQLGIAFLWLKITPY
jgi:FkbM family methyltransferase